MPCERRIFIGLEIGKIVTVNCVTGETLSAQQVHTQDVTSMVFCEYTKCLISTGAEGSLHIRREVRGGLQALRCLHNAHCGQITCCAYSWKLSVVITGGADSNLCVWDFQTLQLKASTRVHHKGITYLSVCPDRALLVACDGSGSLIMWHYDSEQTALTRLANFRITPNFSPQVTPQIQVSTSLRVPICLGEAH